jgi:hypothetical protein
MINRETELDALREGGFCIPDALVRTRAWDGRGVSGIAPGQDFGSTPSTTLKRPLCGISHMDAVIPAAGRGSRLGTLTDDQPKGLVDVAGRPLLAHVLETAVEVGADGLVVIVGYEAAQIVDRFGDAFEGIPITYVHQR